MVSCLIVAVGIMFALAGVPRGSRASRVASTVCLFVLLLPVIAAVAFVAWLSQHRWGF